jgi:hypothetical protein
MLFIIIASVIVGFLLKGIAGIFIGLLVGIFLVLASVLFSI